MFQFERIDSPWVLSGPGVCGRSGSPNAGRGLKNKFLGVSEKKLPKVGVKQSTRRRATDAAKKATKAPKTVAPKTPKVKAPKSPLAAYIASPTPATKAALMEAANAGRLTSGDVQAALAAEVVQLSELAKKKPREIAAIRPLRVMIQRVLRDLPEVVQPSESSGALFNINLIWKSNPADIGDSVRMTPPAEPTDEGS